MKCGCSISIFLNSANLICRSTDISKCFRGSLRLRDNESRLYIRGDYKTVVSFVKDGNLLQVQISVGNGHLERLVYGAEKS